MWIDRKDKERMVEWVGGGDVCEVERNEYISE